MPLQTRIVALVSAVLLISIVLGAVFAGAQARRSLRAELQAGMTGGAQTIRGAFEDLPRSDHQARDLDQLVDTFNGNRHVMAALVRSDRRVEAASRPSQPGDRAPDWFARLLAPKAESLAFPAPGDARGTKAIVLTSVATADLQAAWAELSGIVTVLCVTTVAGLGLVFVVLRAALSPLRDLSTGFDEIGRGDYRGRVLERGPSEIMRLEKSFNDMAKRLDVMRQRNDGLERQLLTLQDEERAELARDLHDDIGPHLFAVSLDAQMITQLLATGRPNDVPAQVEAIQIAVGHVQREVRGMVARLRPARATDLGLERAIGDLVKVWQARRPEIAFDVEPLVAETGLGESLKDTAFRVIQEAVNNAGRHARPTFVQITLRRQPGGLFVEVRNDGAAPRQLIPGFGLIGMRERVTALCGHLTVSPATAEDGVWVVTAVLPDVAQDVDAGAQ